MIVSSASYATGFLAIMLAHTAELIYVGRFLNGMGLGLVIATVSVYIVEIATTDMRGFLGCFVQFLGSVGVLLTFCLGSLANWWQLSLAHLIMVLPFSLAMLLVPESPRWLIMKGKEWEGEEALKWLRGRGPEALDREIEMIKKELRIRKRERQSITMLLEPEIFKPFIISLLMMFFLQMSGFNVMVFYCGTIFEEVGSSINTHTASIIVGSVLLLSCFVALAVVSQLGRKVMLVLSILGMAASHFVLGTCFYLREQEEEGVTNDFTKLLTNITGGGENGGEGGSPMGWLPLVAIIAFLFLGNVGYGTLIWVVTAELLPPKVRSMANSIIICFAFVAGFIVAKTFVDLVESPLKRSGTFWLYAADCVVGGVFTIIFVPETRNKTIEEIQAIFKTKSGKKSLAEHPGLGHPLDSVT